jgi:hypothetical protein
MVSCLLEGSFHLKLNDGEWKPMPKSMPCLLFASVLAVGFSFASFGAYAQTDEAMPPGALDQQEQGVELLPEEGVEIPPEEGEVPPDEVGVPPDEMPPEEDTEAEPNPFGDAPQ